jgi:predicted amidohydrolase YtcJ
MASTFIVSCNSIPLADAIYYNATIYTVDSNFSIANSLVVRDGQIIAIGNNDLLKQYAATQKVDLQGAFVFPGFIDAHCHFYGYSTDLTKCDLYGTTSFKAVIDRLTEYEKTNQFSWILGRGWDQNNWESKEFPNKQILDSLFPSKPVYLMRIDGHAVLVNQKALDLAGITCNTKIEGGEVEVRNNKLTGILIDNAVEEVKKFIPEFSDEIKKDGILKGQKNCFAVGLTTVADAGLAVEAILFLDSLQKKDDLKMKIYAMAEFTEQSKKYWFKHGTYKTAALHVSSFKLYADGALGSRGACLLKPYADKPGHYGFMLTPIEKIKQFAKEVYANGFQLNSHCIGDSANRVLLQIYNEILPPANNNRWRIEHCQIINKQDLDIFSKLSIIPSVQPTHATSDMYWAENRLGKDRLGDAYAYKDLMRKAGLIAAGSDFPVESTNPLYGFYAAVSRKDQKGFPEGGFQIENAISREDALRSMTIWAAYSCFEENEKGSLEKGKAADFVVLPDNLMTMPDSLLFKTKIKATYLNGKNVFQSE